MQFFSPAHPDLVTVKHNSNNNSYTVEINHDAVLAHFYDDNPQEKKLSAAVIIANLFSKLNFSYQNEANKSVLTLLPKEIEQLTNQLKDAAFHRDYQPRSRNLALMSTERHTETVNEGRMAALAHELSTGIHTQQTAILAKHYVIRR